MNLGHHVAIKVLPPLWEQDPDRLARFTCEAKALASLNHPNIAVDAGRAIAGFDEQRRQARLAAG